MIKYGISEILSKVSETEDFEARVAILKQNDSNVLRHIFRLTYTPGVQWLLPPGKPPLNFNNNPGQQGNLFAEWRRFYLFFPGGNDNLKQSKREAIFIQILESLDPKDAELICSIKDGVMPYDHVDAELVNAAFPGLLPPDALVLNPKSPVAPKPATKPKTPTKAKPVKKAKVVQEAIVDTSSLSQDELALFNEISGSPNYATTVETPDTGLETINELYSGSLITDEEVKALSTFVETSKEIIEKVIEEDKLIEKSSPKPKPKKSSTKSKKENKTS